MKKTLLIFLVCMTVQYSQAQREAANWYFGAYAGLDFNPNGAVNPEQKNDGAAYSHGSCATISDADGNLLFYVGGNSVGKLSIWNKNHQLMPSPENNLTGSAYTEQGVIIVPFPNHPNNYYVFTIGEGKLNYYIVDMTLDGGNGDIVGGRTQFGGNALFNNKIAAVKGAGDYYWIVTFGTSNSLLYDTFYTYKLNASGLISNPIISNSNSSGPINEGYIKLSPNGNNLAIVMNGRSFIFSDFISCQLYQFNNSTGKITNPLNLGADYFANNAHHKLPKGIAFSVSGSKFYVIVDFNIDDDNVYYKLIQFDLDSNTPQEPIPASIKFHGNYGDLQLAIDGKIYLAAPYVITPGYPDGINRYLGRIYQPEELGYSCVFNEAILAFSEVESPNATLSSPDNKVEIYNGFPNFVASFFNVIIYNQDEMTCEGSPVNFAINSINEIVSVSWDFGDGSPLDTSETPTHIYPILNDGENHKYSIILNTDYDWGYGIILQQEYRRSITIYALPQFIANASISAINQCDDNNDGLYDFDFHELKDEEILSQISVSSSLYRVRYFPSETDLDADTNEIITTTTIPYNQTIWARVENKTHIACYDKISFEVHVYDTPTNSPQDLYYCDAATTNIPWDLTSNTDIILNGLNANDFNVQYYTSEANFQANNPIADPTNFISTANPQTIIVHTENIHNTTCSLHSTFNLIATYFAIPNTNVILVQCDEDSNPYDGITHFNLNEANAELVNTANDYTFQYYENSALTSAINPQGDYINLSNPQTIYASITDDRTGCNRVVPLELAISTSHLDPNLLINLQACDDDNTEDGLHLFNLEDADSQILASLPTSANYAISYYTSLIDAELEQNALPLTDYMSMYQTEQLYVRVDNNLNNDCFGIGRQVQLTTNPLPQPVLLDYILCTNIGFVPIDASINDGNTYDYLWNDGSNSAILNATVIGDYTVTVTNTVTNCSNTATAHVTDSSAPETIAIEEDITNSSITINVTGIGDYEYSIDNGNNYFDINYFEYLEPRVYHIKVRDKNNCGSIQLEYGVVKFPQFFTPNGDDYNDFWLPLGIPYPELALIKIYDRYGKLLTVFKANSQGWDGKINGTELPASDYWYHIVLPAPDNRDLRGHFSLKR